jgi:hypothetical protein
MDPITMNIKIPSSMKKVALLAMVAREIRDPKARGWLVDFLKKGDELKDDEIIRLINEVLDESKPG